MGFLRVDGVRFSARGKVVAGDKGSRMTLPLDQVKVVDADTHMTERHDLWTSRAPAKFKDRVPRVEQVDGSATWVVEGGAVLGRAGAGGVVDKHGKKGR
jgi:hypothetical protein